MQNYVFTLVYVRCPWSPWKAFINNMFYYYFVLVFIPIQSPPLCRVWRSRYWPADPRSRERVSPTGGYPGKTCGHDGKGQDRTRLLQVRSLCGVKLYQWAYHWRLLVNWKGMHNFRFSGGSNMLKVELMLTWRSQRHWFYSVVMKIYIHWKWTALTEFTQNMQVRTQKHGRGLEKGLPTMVSSQRKKTKPFSYCACREDSQLTLS